MAFDPDEYLADEGGTAVAEFDPNEYLGVIQPGNIDLDKRPVLKNADGSISTEKSKSFEIDGKEVLIPTVVNGKIVTDQEAIAHFKETGEHLGIFTDPKAATTYAKALHERQDKTYHFDPDEYLGIVPTDVRQGPPAPIDYLAGGGDQETMAHADEPLRETGQELAARGVRLGNLERELSPAEYNAAQGIPQPPGPIPWYLTQEAADKGTGQSALETALGGLTDVSAGTMAQEARARQEAQYIAEKRFADAEQRDRRALESTPGYQFADAARRGVESLLGPTERLTEPAFPLQRPLAQQPRWQDQPTLAGKIGAFERETAAGIVNFPVDAWNFATSPVGGAALATGPIEAGIGAMGFTTEAVAPLVHRAIAAGFTADMIRAGLQAGTLQDQVSAALGAGLGFYGAAHPKAAKGVEPRVERPPTDLQWNGYEWVQPAKPSAAGRRAAAELRAKGETIQPDTIQEQIETDRRFHGESGREMGTRRPWVQAEPPPVPNELLTGRYTATGQEITPESPLAQKFNQKMADTEASVPATGSPSTATTKAAETVLPTDTQSLPTDAGGVRPIPMAETAVRPKLMQYKRMDDSGTGVNEADRIKGEYDPLKAGILLLWEPTNPSEYGLTGNQKYIVANGHHRWQFFSEKGVEHVNAQILRESDGYSAGDARSKAAELNIADGKGTVYDAANFIRDEAATHGEDAALARAKQIGAKGAQAATIGLKSGDDLYTAFINERISPDQAAAIAEGAPHNNALQRVGIEAAREGMKHADLWNYMQAVKAKMESGAGGREPSEVEVDMFGESDANLNDAKAMAKRATLIQTELGERVNAVAGALRRPETAKKMGVDISDPAAVQEQLVKLRMIREQARTWRSYPTIRDLVFREDLTPKEVVEELMKPEAPKQDHPLPDPSTGTAERAAIINREIDKLNGMAQTPERDARLKLLNDWIDAFGRPKKAEPGQEPSGPYHLQRHPARTPQQEETWAVVQGESGLDAPANPYGEYGLTREAAEARLKELNERVKPEEPPIDTGNVGHRPIFEIMDELNGLEEKLRDIRLGREPSIMRGAYEKRIEDLQEELAAAERAEEPGRRAAEEVAEKYERERAERERLARESSDPVRVRALQDALAIHKEKLFHEELGIGRKQKSKTAIAKAQRDVNRVQNELDMLTGKGLKPGDRVKLVSTGKEYNVTSEIYKSTETRGGGVFKGDLVVNLHDGEMGHATLFKPLNEVTRIEPGEAGTTEAATVEMRMATPKEKGIAYAITDAMRKGLSFEEALVRLGSVGDDVRVDLVRSIAEEPLRQQADLFGNDMPFNLEGETTLPSADTGDMGQGPTSSEHPGQTQFAFTEESAAPPSGPGPTPPLDIANDPEFTAMSMLGLPEVVRFAEGLLHIGIKVMRELRALQGRAAGVFSYTTGHAGKGEIHIKAEIADLLTEQDKAALQAEALEWATENAAHEREIPILTKRRYEYLLNQAYDEAKKHPSVRALRVLWHEIGHASDWFGANWYKLMGSVDKTLERGNIFGHIAGLQDYLKDVIALDPFRAPGRKLTGHERADMRRRAKEEMQRQVGPMQEIVRTIITDEPEYQNTGLTAESIVSLINSNTARTDMPELYRWFAQLPGHVKRDILRDAMRGILNHLTSNAPAGARVPTGRRIRRTQEVRETVGREPTVEEINAMFKEMFEAEMKNRNLADLEIVKQELRNSIAWWRQTETIEPYFDTPKEMYAEAFSIFMNNPQALARRAPTYTRLLWNYMNARPEVSKLYEKIQSEIKSGGLGAVREQTIIDSWHENNRKSVEAARARALSTATTFEDILNNVIYDIDRRMGVIYRAARGSPSEGALRAAIGNYLYRQTAHEEYLRRIEMTITPDLIRNNMDGDDLALLGMYQRDLHERFKIFNPYGIDPLAAKEGLDHLKARLGPQRFAVLERLRAQEHAIYDELVLQPMKAEGMLNDLAQDYVDHNIHYMTYDVIQKSGDGIAHFMNNFYGEVGAHFYRQVGTLKEISQPRTATTLKALSLISATSRNKVKRLTVQMLHESQAFPNEKIMEADSSWNETHKRMDYHIVKSPNIGTIAYLDKGVVKAFYVRRVFADAVNHGNEMDHWMHNAAVQATGWVKSGYTQLAYGFWPFAFIKDMSAFFIQMHGQRKFNEVWQRGATTNMPAPLYWLSTVEENIKAARATFRAQPNPWADAALRRRFVISRADPRGIWSAAETMHEVKLASYGHTPMAWTKEGRNVNRITQLWNSYREVGQILERSNKIAGMRYLDERYPQMPEWKKAEIIRERAGSPDFLQRGGSAADIDFFWMFYNPWKEGVRSLTRAARDDTFAFASKTTMLVVAPSVIQAVAASGGMGDETRRKYRSIPDYDLTNYFCVPLAWADDDQRKVLYFRFPLWEGARLMHSLLWHVTTGRSQGIGSIGGGQLPSLNSLLQVAMNFMVYETTGQNPMNLRTGQPVLDEDVRKAGGWGAQKALLKDAWNQLPGASLLYRFQDLKTDQPPRTKIEQFLAMPVVQQSLGKFVKISDRGIFDIDRHILAPDEQYKATVRLGVKEVTRKLLNKEPLSDEEKLFMRIPYAVQYLSDTFGPNATNFTDPERKRLEGKSPEQQMMILEKNPSIQR